MVICDYCNEPCFKYQDITPYNEHRVCVKQKEQRYKDLVCIRCGENNDNNRMQCESCRLQLNPPFKGYVGPPTVWF